MKNSTEVAVEKSCYLKHAQHIWHFKNYSAKLHTQRIFLCKWMEEKDLECEVNSEIQK